ERLAALTGSLPEGAGPPVMVPLESSSATILTMGMTSGRLGLMELRSLADYTVVPRLLSVQGVADVNVFGGEVKQLQIQVLPERLRRYGLGLEDVLQAAREATGVSAGGFIENSNQRIALRTVGLPITPAELQAVVLTRANGGNVTLGDVAHVAYGMAPPIGAAAVNGRPGVLMMVIGQYGANTLSVSQRVVLTPDLFRPANYIETSVHNLSGHLLVGGVFVILVLFLFLFDLRTAFISALAIPLSLLGAALVLRQLGVNLNVMVLGGLAIALGEV